MQYKNSTKIENYLHLDSTIRAQPIENTINSIKPILKKIGVTRVANVTGLDEIGIPVAISIRPNAKHLSVSQGKGTSWELAYISATMESIEAYHAENPAQPDLYGNYRQLSKANSVLPLDIFTKGFFQIDHLYDIPIGWVKSLNLVTQEEVYLPHALICLDSTSPRKEYGFFLVTSNGLAAGNVLDEAICHGIYEVIERDSLFHWKKLSIQKRTLTQIQLDTIDSVVNQELLSKFASIKLSIQVWDITSHLQIPAFHCAIYDSDKLRNLGIFTGTGTHLSKEIALTRALTEAAQTRLTLITGSRDDVFFNYYQKQHHGVQHNEQYSHGNKTYQECMQPAYDYSFEANKMQLLPRLKESGYSNVIMINHTKPEIGIPVVHIFIPGLKIS